MCWGLAATQGVFTGFHIDSDSLATTIYCVNKGGLKWWVVIGPKDKSDTAAFASVENMYAFHNDWLNMAALGDVQVEAVLLRPSVRLYMCPNTPHAVLMPEASICHGGHYLTVSNLRSTCYGFLMGFSLSTLLTNTMHTSACQLLFQKILAYFYNIYTKGRPEEAGKNRPLESPVPHVPDPSTFDGIHDLFSLCNVIEMANILHPDSYHTGLSVSQQQEMIRGQFLSRAIVSWVISNYDIELVTTETFYWNYLAYQAHAICYAKTFGDSQEAYSYMGVPLANKVHALIKESFQGVDSFWEQWESFVDVQLGTFAWPKDDLHSVKIRTIVN
ncbi:hypothetical protein L208DRAFT_1332790 [Tricholoma matsutake]|nr:hypothetical protein L208DRAFT_1332790 [Tricholoma matsutake 945]